MALPCRIWFGNKKNVKATFGMFFVKHVVFPFKKKYGLVSKREEEEKW